MRYLLYLAIVIIVFMIDLLSKNRAIKQHKKIIYNKGAFIGLLKNKRKLLLPLQVIALLILLGLIIYVETLYYQLPLVLILGGSIGNIYEHIKKGKVTDFIKVRKLYVNMADLFIFTGFNLFIVISIILM